MNKNDESSTLIEFVQLIAESPCEKEELENFEEDKMPDYEQIIKSLLGLRGMASPGKVEFSHTEKLFIDSTGMATNIHPIFIEIANIQITRIYNPGDIEQIYFEQQDILRAQRQIEGEKDKIKNIGISYGSLLGNDYFRNALASYSRYNRENPDDLICLYEIRDAIQKYFEKEKTAVDSLGLTLKSWKKFGELFNNKPYHGGRHNGVHVEPRKNMPAKDLTFVEKYAKELLIKFGDYLNEQANEKVVLF